MREPGFWHRPSLISRVLWPVGAAYGAVAARRMQGEGIATGVPVLCVGNYHLGGAGKTPAVLLLARMLRDLGETPVILSRGYGGQLRGPIAVDTARHLASDVGDEPLMLARSLPVVVARDRIDGLALAKSRGASLILMDDGFQSPGIAKDASLIVIDAIRGIGNGHVFPAGPLRAPLPPQLARTDALIVIGEGTAAVAVAEVVAGKGKPVFSAHFRPKPDAVARLHGKRVLAFAGIGDPRRFFRTLHDSGIEVVRERVFPDHHPFARGEIEALLMEAEGEGLTPVTTEKDLVRLQTTQGIPDWARNIMPFEVSLEVEEALALRKFLADRLFQARRKAR